MSKRAHLNHLLLIISLYAFSSSLYIGPLSAEESQPQKRAISHYPIKSAELPAPGTPMTLSFDFSGIRGSISRERLFVVRDGKLLDVHLLEGVEPGTENLSHNATVNAPLVELKYWAVVTTSDGQVHTSSSYLLRRNCVPNIALSSIDDPPDSEIQERLARYVQQSKNLEKDLAQYEMAIELLESLVGQMKESK